jgi:hypothetical protein
MWDSGAGLVVLAHLNWDASHGAWTQSTTQSNEEVTFRRIALGITKATLLPARDVAYLVHLCLVDENEGQLRLTGLGRERYQGLPNGAAVSDVEDEATVNLRRHLLHARGR